MGKFLQSIGLEPGDIGLVFMLIGVKLKCSSAIDDVHITHGYGELDEFGFWEYPAFFSKIHRDEDWVDTRIEKSTWRSFCKARQMRALSAARALAVA